MLVRPELVVEIALDGVQSSTRYAGGVALRFARVKRYRPDKNAGEADMIDDLPARAGDEFQASGPSKEVPNRNTRPPGGAMSRLIVLTAMTVDGVMTVEEWFVPEGDHMEASLRLFEGDTALLYGRKNYEGLAAYWMAAEGEWAGLG